MKYTTSEWGPLTVELRGDEDILEVFVNNTWVEAQDIAPTFVVDGWCKLIDSLLASDRGDESAGCSPMFFAIAQHRGKSA